MTMNNNKDAVSIVDSVAGNEWRSSLKGSKDLIDFIP